MLVYIILYNLQTVLIIVGIKQRDTIAFLRQNTSVAFQTKDIYNIYSSFKREQLHGLSANDRLIQHLTDKGIHFQLQVTDQNRTEYLFIAYPESIQLALKTQDVVIVDSTYTTNKSNMPLLHIIGEFTSFIYKLQSKIY
jgi:hypothetical protein